MLLILMSIASSTLVGQNPPVILEITCTADNLTTLVEFQSTLDGHSWDEIGNSATCYFIHDTNANLICYRARAIGETGKTSAYSDWPACYSVACH